MINQKLIQMMHLYIKILFFSIIGCKQNNKIEKTHRKIEKNIIVDSIKLIKTKDTIKTISKHFIGDTIYINEYNKNIYFLDAHIKNGFIRNYYYKNRIIDKLVVKNNRIINGLYLKGVAINNVINEDFELFEYDSQVKNGIYAYQDNTAGSTVYGSYIKGKKSGKWIYHITNGKWSGTVNIEYYKNNKLIKRLTDYYDWEEQEKSFLKTKKAKSIKKFINYLFDTGIK